MYHSLRFQAAKYKARFQAAGFVAVLALTAASGCTGLPQTEHYMLRSEYYRGLEEARRTGEAEKQAIRERLIGLQAELAREEGRRLQVEEEAARLRRDLVAAEARLDSVTTVAVVDAQAGRSEVEMAIVNVRRLESELETMRVSHDRVVAELAAVRAEQERQRETTTVVIDDLAFGAGSSRLTPREAARLKERTLALLGADHVSVIGYTDDREARAPIALAAQRAAEVAAWLRSTLGVPSERITVVSRGASDPRVPNTTPESRARNRRVEIIAVDR